MLYRAHLNLQKAAEILRSHGHLTDEVRHLLEFVESQHAGKNGRALDQGAESQPEGRPTRELPVAR